MKLKLLCVLCLSTISMSSIAGGNHGSDGSHIDGTGSHHTENEARIANESHNKLNDCSRKGINMLMELDKFLFIPTEDAKEVNRFLMESEVIQSASKKEKELFLTLAAKKDQEGMSSAKVKKLFAESIIERCK